MAFLVPGSLKPGPRANTTGPWGAFEDLRVLLNAAMSRDEHDEILVHPVKAGRAARCEQMVLRENAKGRVILRMEIVEKDDLPDGGVKATLLFQRKADSQPWEEYEGPTTVHHLGNCKAGTELRIELKTEEVLHARQLLNNAQAIKDQFEIPATRTRFVGIQEETDFFGRPTGRIERLAVRRDSKEVENIIELLRTLLDRNDVDEIASAVGTLDEGGFQSLASSVNSSALERLLHEWDQQEFDASEPKWQDLLQKHPFALQQLFYCPTVFVAGNVVAGGRTWNQGDKRVDFLMASAETRQSVIVEIKRRDTVLLASEYRSGVYSLSPDLSWGHQPDSGLS